LAGPGIAWRIGKNSAKILPITMALSLTKYLLLLLLLLGSRFAQALDLQTPRQNVLLRVIELGPIPDHRLQLSAVVDGNSHPIDEVVIAAGVSRLTGYAPDAEQPAWLLDAGGRYLYYTTLTGCGFEGEGMAIFRSDLRGSKIEPVLGGCGILTMEIVPINRLNYLLVRESHGDSHEAGFWIFDMETLRPIVHADGILRKRSGANATYDYCASFPKWKKDCQKVTDEILQNRRIPLRLRSRHPIRARVKANSLVVSVSEGLSTCDEESKHSLKLPKPSGQVAILQACPDEDHYEIYYRGLRGTGSREDLETIKIE